MAVHEAALPCAAMKKTPTNSSVLESLESRLAPAGIVTLSLTTAGALTLEEVAAVLNVRRQFEALVRTMPIEGVEYDTAPVAQTGDPLDLSGNPIPFGDDPFEQGTLIDAPSQRKYT